MSSELQQDYLSGKVVYYLLRNSSAQIWNGVTFENYTTANFANYPITSTEQGAASGYYVGNMPSISAGVYSVIAKQQVGGSPAESDITIGTGTIIWDGSSIQTISSIVAALLEQDITGTIENAAAKLSLATAILKLVSKFDITAAQNSANIFKSDGVTIKASQAITKNANLTPVQALGVAS